MSIEITCPKCGATLRVGERMLEASFRCPKCRSIESVKRAPPADDTPAKEDTSPAKSTAAIGSPATTPDYESPENPYRSPVEFPAALPRTVVHKHSVVHKAVPSNLASRRRRLAAVVVDAIFPVILATVAIYLAPDSLEELRRDFRRGTPSTFRVFSTFPVASGIDLCFELLQAALLTVYGQSLGKLLLEIRVIRVEDDGNPGFFRAVLLRRWLIGFLALAPGIGRIRCGD